MKRLIPFALLAGCVSTPDPAAPILGGQFAIDA